MAMKPLNNQCPLCKGSIKPGKTTFTVDLGFSVILGRNVPANVCDLCGADWIEDAIAEQLEQRVESAKSNYQTVAISQWLCT
mgnify:FL=1